MNRIVLHASDLDGFLTEKDKASMDEVDNMYSGYLELCRKIENAEDKKEAEKALVENARTTGHKLEEITRANPRIHVYSFETPQEQHGEASRIIAKLRNPKTEHEEFLYYIQRAYEIMFAHAFAAPCIRQKRSIIQKTPVTVPVRNYAVHRIPDIDDIVHNAVMCVMLRGALLPSMIISKEIEDYSSDGFITPFALFRIKRDESCTEDQMRYVLDLDKSFFRMEDLEGKDLVFADPMNATGGSLVTIVKYLEKEGVRPKSIRFINVISALKGSLRVVRALPQAEVYTLWMDPVLNSRAYIMPGLGDAGDRLNGEDGDRPRNIIQLVADYGQAIVNLYRDQVRKIEETVLG